jgi:hypothetical protein
MANAAGAVLLISADFLASAFCVQEEVPALLKRQEEQGWLISLTHDLPSSLVLSLPLENRYPRAFSVYPAASQPAVFALAGYPSISQIPNLLDSR